MNARLRRRRAVAAAACAAALLAGCASMVDHSVRQRQAASLLAYLYPDQARAEAMAAPGVAELRVPFRLGLAFVPPAGDASGTLSEADRSRLLGQVRQAFRDYPFLREIVLVPTHDLQPGGGFDNLRQVAALMQLDVVALVSYDQVQNAGQDGWSLLYWTGVGAYLVEGDRFDIMTLVDTAVVDVRSRRLLLRATGSATTKGSATMVGFEQTARTARTASFDEAVAKMIPALAEELRRFRERAPADPGIRLVLPPGYDARAGAAPPR